MNKVSKKIDKELKQLAAILPADYYPVAKRMSGDAIMADKSIPERLKKDIDLKGTYVNKLAGKRQINHLRRLRKAYKSRGVKGVQDYMDSYKSEVERK